jgi:hypothetical protein
VRTLVVLARVVVAVPLVAFVLFVRPPTADVDAVDAVGALAGGAGERLRVARELVEDDGAASVLVLSYGPSSLCAGDHPYEVICFVPDPSTTAGEAREVGRLADEHGWSSLAVVTSTHHVTRSRVLVGQCTDAEVAMVDAGSALPTQTRRLRVIRHEVEGLFAALLLDPAC